MQIVSTIGAASGSAGGFVASHGRTGQQLRAGRPARQPRTASQQNARALTGSAASLWRALTSSQQAAWVSLAATCPRTDRLGQVAPLSGFALFVSCTRNLSTVGLAAVLRTAPRLPSLPALLGFAVAPIYDQPDQPRQLVGFYLSWNTIQAVRLAGIVRASAALSPARGNVRPSDLRVVAALNPCPSQSLIVWAGWLAAWGAAPASGVVTFAMNLLDPLSGFAGPGVTARVGYASTVFNPYIPGDITVSFEGTPEAVLSGQVIEFGGDPEAGG